MTDMNWRHVIVGLLLAIVFLGLGFWAGQSPLRYLRMDNLKCEFIFPPLTIQEGVNSNG